MRSSRNLLKSVQNLAYRHFNSYHHQFRQHDKQKPSFYPIRSMNYIDPINDLKNYYKILGVERCASHSQIKSAYYCLAKRYHPDNKCGKFQSQFNEIVEAYNVLIDDNKRNEYNKYGKINDLQEFMKHIGEKERVRTINERIKLSDLLQKGPPKISPGSPEIIPGFTTTEATINIDFMQSVLGLKKDFALKCIRKCPKCCGTYSHKTEPEKCKQCLGTGVFQVKSKTLNSQKICDVCQGKCVTLKSVCKVCENKGYIYQSQAVHIVIPPGICSGDIIPVKNPNSEIPKKYIAVKVNVSNNNSKFKRKGFNIHSDIGISIPDAILGAKVKVQTIHGLVEVKIPPGAESHSTIILHGSGIRTPKCIGDHIVTLKVEIPKIVNERVRKVLSQWSLEKKLKA